MGWRQGTGTAPTRLTLTFVLSLVVAGCTSTPQVSEPSSTTAQSPATSSSAAPSVPATSSSSPAGPPTYYSPTDTTSFSLSGPIHVDQALQDPFSNLIQRGVLHDQLITLDVVGTPDYPVQPGVATTVLFGTCKCSMRGQGMHLTIEDGSAISDAGGGSVRIHGTFRPVQTEADGFTLQRP